jgi:hypothetical protein
MYDFPLFTLVERGIRGGEYIFTNLYYKRHHRLPLFRVFGEALLIPFVRSHCSGEEVCKSENKKLQSGK